MPHPLKDDVTILLPGSVPLDMALVRPGRFLMGSDAEDAENDEQPVHEVHIDTPYYMGVFPVTQQQWAALFPQYDPSKFKGPNRPVERISWNDIVNGTQEGGPPQAFLPHLNRHLVTQPDWHGWAFDLPTEAQWEYAAKGGHLAPQDLEQRVDTTELYSKYAGGDDMEKAGWHDESFDGSTHPVGRKQANQLGLYDLSGNVLEWCADAYDWSIYQERVGEVTKKPPAVEATENRPYRVLRGGSWFSSARFCRLARRAGNGPAGRDNCCGFRLVLAPVQAGE